MEGNLRFKVGWDSLIVGRKFTVFALFYFVCEGKFQVQAPRGLYLDGRFNGGFFALRVGGGGGGGGLLFGRAHFWNFTVFLSQFYLKRVLLLTSQCHNK